MVVAGLLVDLSTPLKQVFIDTAATFREDKRIPMDEPAGQYNLRNRITPSEGARH